MPAPQYFLFPLKKYLLLLARCRLLSTGAKPVFGVGRFLNGSHSSSISTSTSISRSRRKSPHLNYSLLPDFLHKHQCQRRRPHSAAQTGEKPTTKRVGPILVRTFPIVPLRRFETQRTSYQQPKESACFGCDENFNRTSGEAELNYYISPKVEEIDLNVGMDEYIRKKSDYHTSLDRLLKTVTELREAAAVATATSSGFALPDFICYRGTLAKLLITPFYYRDGWEIRATRFRNTIYMEQVSDDVPEERMQQLIGGLKFEKYCTSPKPRDITTAEDLTHRREEVMNQNVEYVTVFETKLGKHRFVMGAEVDCIDGPKLENPISQYVELKTCKAVTNASRRRIFEGTSLLKFWAQSFLCGIRTVVVGFRLPGGKVESVKEYKTLEIPRLVQRKGSWNPFVCLNFANNLLEEVRQVLTTPCEENPQSAIDGGGDPEVTWIIRHRPFCNVEILREGRGDSLLPQNYIDSFSK